MSHATALEMIGLGINYETLGGVSVKVFKYCQSPQFDNFEFLIITPRKNCGVLMFGKLHFEVSTYQFQSFCSIHTLLQSIASSLLLLPRKLTSRVRLQLHTP